MLFRRDREEVFLYTTNPPYLGIIGALVSMLRRHPYLVLLHDSYPHLAVWVGKIRGKGIIERIWHRLNRLIYRRAKQTIVLCDAARSLVCRDYAIEPTRVHVIPNWADGAKLFPMPKTDSSIAKMTGAADHFTVMYSGNLGLYYEFETILGAAERLKDTSFRLILTGSGGKRDWIAGEIKRRGLNNTLLLPYQPFDRLNESLNACDASLVTIAQGIEGISFPSKLYSSLAVGRPILAISEPNSDLQRIVESEKVGHWFALGDSESVASRIRQMIDRPAECAQAGANARSLFLRMFTIQASGARYAEVLALAASSGDAP